MKDNKKDERVERKNKTFFRRFRRGIAVLAIASVLFATVMSVRQKEADAFLCITVPCWACNPIDCIVSAVIVKVLEMIMVPIIKQNIEDHINSEQNWILDEFFYDYWLNGVGELTDFLGAFGMYQVEMIGTFFDAKIQLETRRDFYKLHAEAHRDYHPSEDFCWFGTNIRSMVSTERRAQLNKEVLAKEELSRQIGKVDTLAARGPGDDQTRRWQQFVETYCDPKDNAWSGAGSGLDFACDHDGPGGSAATGATDRSRVNIDVNYTRLLGEKRTLDVNFSDTTLSNAEQDVIAMSMNLYGHNVLSRKLSDKSLQYKPAQRLYMILRSIAAKRSIAQNSFNSIVALKSEGTNGTTGPGAHPDTGTFMAAAIKDLMPTGVSDADVYSILGRNPSYYAQLEFLAKKIYQNPEFFANLYDKPANVERKSVAMKAVNLMLDRAIFESELRQEMILSVLLSSELHSEYRNVNAIMAKTTKGGQ